LQTSFDNIGGRDERRSWDASNRTSSKKSEWMIVAVEKLNEHVAAIKAYASLTHLHQQMQLLCEHRPGSKWRRRERHEADMLEHLENGN